MMRKKKSAPSSELTSTIHLSQLRAVPNNSAEQGHELSALSAENRDIVESLAPGSAMFIVLAGPNLGARYLIDQAEVKIGRDPSSDIALDDITVSRRHALVSVNFDPSQEESARLEVVVTDLKSLNGTYVNAVAISSTSLKSGDEVHIGKYRLTFFPSRTYQGSK